jgi:phospholipid transport system substrate-binding protein
MRIATKILISALLAAAPLAATAQAQAPDPSIAPITALDSVLLQTMRHQDSGGQALSAAVDQTFNMPAMTQFVIGTRWAQLSASDQAAVTAALRRYVIARFADEFDSYAGEQFSIDPDVQTRGPDKLVRTHVAAPGGQPSHVDYRMRAAGAGWKAVDVYYNGVSQVTTQRADLETLLASGDVASIVARIDQATHAVQAAP